MSKRLYSWLFIDPSEHYRPYALTSRLHNNDAMLGVKLRTRVVLAERIGAQQLSQCAGPGQPGGVACMQGLVLWLQCLAMAHVATFDPQRGWAPFCDVICIRSIIQHGHRSSKFVVNRASTMLNNVLSL